MCLNLLVTGKPIKTFQTVSLLSSDQWGEYHFHTPAMISVSLLFLSPFLCLRHHLSLSLSPEQCMDCESSELVDDSYFHFFLSVPEMDLQHT